MLHKTEEVSPSLGSWFYSNTWALACSKKFIISSITSFRFFNKEVLLKKTKYKRPKYLVQGKSYLDEINLGETKEGGKRQKLYCN